MYFNLILVLKGFFFTFFFASSSSALHLSYESKFIIVVNTGIPKRFHAHNDTDLWDRGSISFEQLVHGCTTSVVIVCTLHALWSVFVI